MLCDAGTGIKKGEHANKALIIMQMRSTLKKSMVWYRCTHGCHSMYGNIT